MSTLAPPIHTQFGIDEVYLHEGFAATLLEKLQQRALLSLDAEDNFIKNHVSHDMILIFHKKAPGQPLIYKFLKVLHQHKDKENFIKSNTLLNEEELFVAIKSKTFIFVTPKILIKQN